MPSAISIISANVEVNRGELTASVLKENLVIQPQTQLRHAGQEHTHFDGAHDLAAEHVAIGAHLCKENSQLTVRYSSLVVTVYNAM